MSRYTPEQELAIQTKDSCVVSAGAGSGKTMVLSQRFLRLVRSGVPCNCILTITFTKKAAAEMKSRIRGLLEREGLVDQLAIFHSARIGTVDSFCHEVVRRDCRRYGITGNFRIADASELDPAYREIAAELLTDQAQSPAGKYLLAHADPSEIVRFLCSLAWRTGIAGTVIGQNDADACIEFVQKSLDENLSALREYANAFIRQFAQTQALENDVLLISRRLEELDGGNPDAFFNLELSRKYGSKELKESVQELKKGIADAANLCHLCVSTLQNREGIVAFYQLASQFEELAIRYRRSTGCITFSDAMHMAIDILTVNKRVRSYYKNAFSHIMIDEFQDNNDDYRRLVYLLAERKDRTGNGVPEPQDLEEGKIFLVGDEKQSIYRFRGADVSVFKRMQREIAACGGQVLELDTNFRSTPALLENFNRIFSKAMAGSSKDYEAVFHPLRSAAGSTVPSRTVLHCLVHPYRDDNPQGKASYTESEAHSLADLIYRMTHTDDFPIDTPSGPARPQYGDIAILLRALSSQADYEKALRLKGIPYTLGQTHQLMKEALVNDFYNLLNLAVHPDDRLSRACVQNSPLANALEDGSLDTLAGIAGLHGIAAAVDYIWFDLGYRAFIMANPANQVYSEHYIQLYALAADSDMQGRGMPAFLQQLRRDMKADRPGKDDLHFFGDHSQGVSIMTIHKSKGLEFPIVIIADMDSDSSGNRHQLDYDQENGNVFLPCTPDGGRLRNLHRMLSGDSESLRSGAELIRLFYVACTRAKQHLVFSAAPALTKFAVRDVREAGNLFSLLASSCSISADSSTCELLNVPSWLEVMTFERIDRVQTFSSVRMDPKAPSLNAPWYSAAVPDSFDYSDNRVAVTSLAVPLLPAAPSLSAAMMSLESDAVIREKGLQTDFGTYVHALIENALRTGDINAESVPDMQSDASLTPLQKNMIRSDALSLVRAFTQSSLYRRLTESSYTLYPERRFNMYDSSRGVLVTGSIDLLAVDETENEKPVLVIDFKTDSVRNPEEHRMQLETYAKAVSSVYRDRQVQAVVFYLRQPSDPLVL